MKKDRFDQGHDALDFDNMDRDGLCQIAALLWRSHCDSARFQDELFNYLGSGSNVLDGREVERKVGLIGAVQRSLYFDIHEVAEKHGGGFPQKESVQ